MANVTVIGAQWGDEGKGKVVDWLAERAAIVVRFQGGHNAGHTLVVDGVEHRLSLLPAAVVRPQTRAVIGGGVVLDVRALLEERARLEAAGFPLPPSRLFVAETASLVLPFHARVDRARERARGAGAIGTTGRGIGPAIEDRAGRRALRLCDLAERDALGERLEVLLHHNNALLRAFGEEEVSQAQVLGELEALAPLILPFAADVPNLLRAAVEAGETILFEGAQGVLLDTCFGTYPFVTSSRTLAAEASLGTGLAARHCGRALGIVKAYATRVGAGPFPSELHDAVGRRLGERGCEFGTVTGRRRRCGWLDGTALRHAVETAGLDALVLTKIDVLDGFEEIKLATAYELDGERITRLPPHISAQARLEPVYESLPGWSGSTAGVRREADLPSTARAYIERIEEIAGVPVALVSTGAPREDMIVRADPFV